MPGPEDLEVSVLKGVGASLAQRLEKLGIVTLQDLLFHLPHRYEDRTRVLPIGRLHVGDSGVVEGEVVANDVVQGRRRSLQITLRDDSGFLVLRFFHFSAAQRSQLEVGNRLRCYGEVRPGRAGLEIYHPEYKLNPGPLPTGSDARLTPVYPLTEGIQQPRIRGLCEQALGFLGRHPLQEWLPDSILSDYQLPEINTAVRLLHAPPADADTLALMESRHPAQQRLIMEELLAHHLSLLKLRAQVQSWQAIPLLPGAQRLDHQLLEALPFRLTGAQQRVCREIRQDLSQPVPMLRLVQGDVGSGKTVIAALAALQAIGAGSQVALMAPTEILAEQHYLNFREWL